MPYIIMTPKAPHAGPGTYRRIVLLETTGDECPAMASARARGVKRIIRDFGTFREGKTSKSEYVRTLEQAVGILFDLERGANPDHYT